MEINQWAPKWAKPHVTVLEIVILRKCLVIWQRDRWQHSRWHGKLQRKCNLIHFGPAVQHREEQSWMVWDKMISLAVLERHSFSTEWFKQCPGLEMRGSKQCQSPQIIESSPKGVPANNFPKHIPKHIRSTEPRHQRLYSLQQELDDVEDTPSSGSSVIHFYREGMKWW